METPSSFSFDTYDFSPHSGKISLRYSFGRDMQFTETIIVPTDGIDMDAIDHEALDRALFALHLIGGISYFKAYCPKEMFVRSGQLTRTQAQFWTTLYTNGLGEFFYRNNLDFRGLINFPANAYVTTKLKPPRKATKPIKRYLVPIGGGKDSIATIELLRRSDAQCMLLRMEPHPIIDELAHIAGLPMITVKRSIDPLLFELNKKGALNGHIPITAYLSLLSVVVGILFGFDGIVMSNEQSANSGNVRFKGLEINHQWSKSLLAERALRNYIQHSIDPAMEYFSLIRPLTELHVTKIFAQFPQYFTHFTSCNKNWKIASEGNEPGTLWCGTCPKCAFVFALLAAFLPAKQVTEMFGKNLYDDEALLPLYRELLGLTGHKPFECVGTPEETKAAFLLARKRGDMKTTAAMKMFEAEVLPSIENADGLIAAQFTLAPEHFVPEDLVPLLPTT